MVAAGCCGYVRAKFGLTCRRNHLEFATSGGAMAVLGFNILTTVVVILGKPHARARMHAREHARLRTRTHT